MDYSITGKGERYTLENHIYKGDLVSNLREGHGIETTDKSISTQLKVAQIMKICLAYDIIKEVDGYVSTINESVDNSTKLNGDETHGNKQK